MLAIFIDHFGLLYDGRRLLRTALRVLYRRTALSAVAHEIRLTSTGVAFRAVPRWHESD